MQRRKVIQWIPQSILTLGASSTVLDRMAKILLPARELKGPSRLPEAFRAVAKSAIVASLAEPSGRPPLLYIQIVRYKPDVSAERVKQLLTSLQETLSAIPQIRSIRVGRVIDDNRTYDYAVAMEFDNVNDMRTYGNSVIHQNWVKEHNPVALSAAHATLTLQMDLDH